MKKTTQKSTALSMASGAFIAFANAGALISIIVLTVSFLMATPVFSQDVKDIEVELSQVEKELGKAALEIQEALDEVGIETGIKIKIKEDDGDARPKLGVYLSDMDFEDAYKMRYPYPHGVLVDGTVRNGNADNAGIIEDDIIMYFGDKKVLYEDHLVRLIRSKRFGDQVQLVYWRDEALDSTLVTFAILEKKEKEKQLAIVKEKEDKKKRRNSRGFGGGGFTPMLVQDDFADVEDLMLQLGLESTPFKTEGAILWGGSGQGYVGNGWFLGGFGNGLSYSKIIDATHSTTGEKVVRDVSLNMGFGGLTIEKRFAPLSWAVIGGGIGLGGGGIDLTVTQKDGEFDWDNTLSDQLIDTKSTSVSFSKAYFIAHPRANMMIKLTPWMRLRAEYGYLYGYSSPGWTTKLGSGSTDNNFDPYEMKNSQDKATDLGANTVSLGLWFGF